MKQLFTCLVVFLWCSWKVDGQTKLERIPDVLGGIGTANARPMMVFKNKLIVNGYDAQHGQEWWKFDNLGLPTLVEDIATGTGNGGDLSYNHQCAVIADTFYFIANDGGGKRIFKWDGLNKPKYMCDTGRGYKGDEPAFLTVLNNKLYFGSIFNAGPASNFQLMSYDPQKDTVVKHTNIYTSSASLAMTWVIAFKNKIYFAHRQANSNLSDGTELFWYDPAVDTIGFYDIGPGTTGILPNSPVILDTMMYFSGEEQATGRQLYSFDGNNTPKRITHLADAGANNAAFKGKIYIAATNDINNPDFEFYVYDPVADTAGVMRNINPTGSSYPGDYLEYKGNLYFRAKEDQFQYAMYRFDGNQALPVKETKGLYTSSYCVYGDDLYFMGSTTAGGDLYHYNESGVGVTNIRLAENVRIYPNPAKDHITIQADLKQAMQIDISVTDEMGRIVLTKENIYCNAGDNKIELDIHALAAGNYYCRLSSGNSTAWTCKLLVSH